MLVFLIIDVLRRGAEFGGVGDYLVFLELKGLLVAIRKCDSKLLLLSQVFKWRWRSVIIA